MEYFIHRKSRLIEIVPYQETWVEEFKAQGIRVSGRSDISENRTGKAECIFTFESRED